MRIAAHGIEAAVKDSASIASAVNIHRGDITNRAVAESFGLPYRPWQG
jgi:alanine dehydrogenase